MTEFLLLLAGLAGLWIGSEALIRGAMSLSDRYNVSDVVVGMLVLAIGTDLPELFVAVDASIHSLGGQDMSGIVIGSAIGSCIGQFGLVFGVAGFIGFAPQPFRLIVRSAIFLIGSIIVLALFSLDGMISRGEGWSLIALYTVYIATLIIWRGGSTELEESSDSDSPLKDFALLLVGLLVLVVAAELTVVNAAKFATLVGLSSLSVSAIIIGMGSSLPELSVSLVALMKKRGGLSVGNLMGSNVLDSLLVPGVGAALSPLLVPAAVVAFDLPVLATITVLVLTFLYISPRGVKAPEAALLLSIYIGYVLVRLTG
jgi:cation:H+ antiporter